MINLAEIIYGIRNCSVLERLPALVMFRWDDIMQKGHRIKEILPGSIAEELEIEPGDILLAINDVEIKDIFDYHYYVEDDYLVVLIEKPDGEQWELEIEKEYDEDLGIIFYQELMDEYRSCRNKCMFCFIDQMPPGMRDTLYFKDDDARLSFLQGNYITLTNMSEEDLERIILYKLSPVNISVHTMNSELRCKMLSNRFAGDALAKLQKLADHHIEMNSQIVLCKGINDGEELEHSISELSKLYPAMHSLSVVPVGLTKYRDNLTYLEKFERDETKVVLEQIHRWQNKLLKELGTRFVFASDEWYITAGYPLPEKDYYEGYGQIENGVGMVRSLIDEVFITLGERKGDKRKITYSIATGVLAGPIMKQITSLIQEKYPNVCGKVYVIRNEFFGEDITVAGLITGQDLKKQLKNQELGEYLILPDVMFRSGEEVFLDDMTATELEITLQKEIRIVESNGQSLVDTILSEGIDIENRHQNKR